MEWMRCGKEQWKSRFLKQRIKKKKKNSTASGMVMAKKSPATTTVVTVVTMMVRMLLLLHFLSAAGIMAQDLRERIMNKAESCFEFIPEKSLFVMNCSVLEWGNQGYGAVNYISLGANETFDGDYYYGGGDPRRPRTIIDLTGIDEFNGLFAIRQDEVKTFREAPVIRNVHVRNGTTGFLDGFIVKKEQSFFVVDSCSSTGKVFKNHGGGICGFQCGCNHGEIRISNSYSTGRIVGTEAGGITGKRVGCNFGTVTITNCHSTGSIEAAAGGGICGSDAGYTNGILNITHSYSTGDILADNSGGIVGNQAGFVSGYIYIKECYSTGKIAAERSGGISGSHAAQNKGQVHIIDCYTRGAISGKEAGGITGGQAGGCCVSLIGASGTVSIINTYAAGAFMHERAGGIIGSIYSHISGTIEVKYSVYNGSANETIAGDDSGSSTLLNTIGISNNLVDDLSGQLYHFDGSRKWDRTVWALEGTAQLPILRFQLQSTTDLRSSIIQGKQPCLRFNQERGLFQLTCNVLNWLNQGYAADTHISLRANEIFDGGGRGREGSAKSVIDLSGVDAFEGLFRISGDVSSFVEAPVIRNVHVRNGTTARKAGFIVQKEQKFFVVESSSSTGDISAESGGICGYGCSHNHGAIRISKSYATGSLVGEHAGGITGGRIGQFQGTVKISQCYSTGSIERERSGGICGKNAGYKYGQVHIFQSFSIGDILEGADGSGGIVGGLAAGSYGNVSIEECYSTGKISARYSGGLCAALAGQDGGNVYIKNCYSRGDIFGDEAGGITGRKTGGAHSSDSSVVHITNAYASGAVRSLTAGGLIGTLEHDALGSFQVAYSVYNGNSTANIVGDDPSSLLGTPTGVSDDLGDITGKLYHYNGTQKWDNTTWSLRGNDVLPVLTFQLPCPTPSQTVTPTPTRTTTLTATPSASATPTSSKTSSPSRSTSPTPSLTVSPSPSTSKSSSSTSGSASPTGTATRSRTGTPSVSKSPSSSGTATRSRTSTPSVSKSPSSSRTMTPSVSPTNARNIVAMKVLPAQHAARSVKQFSRITKRKRHRRRQRS